MHAVGRTGEEIRPGEERNKEEKMRKEKKRFLSFFFANQKKLFYQTFHQNSFSSTKRRQLLQGSLVKLSCTTKNLNLSIIHGAIQLLVLW